MLYFHDRYTNEICEFSVPGNSKEEFIKIFNDKYRSSRWRIFISRNKPLNYKVWLILPNEEYVVAKFIDKAYADEFASRAPEYQVREGLPPVNEEIKDRFLQHIMERP